MNLSLWCKIRLISSDILERNITNINCIFTKREHKKFLNREKKTSLIIEKRRSLRIKKRTQEKRFDDRCQMDDDHHEKCDGDNTVTVIVKTPKQSSLNDEYTSRWRCHYGQPIKAIQVEKK